jgi:hypothetical protein
MPFVTQYEPSVLTVKGIVAFIQKVAAANIVSGITADVSQTLSQELSG